MIDLLIRLMNIMKNEFANAFNRKKAKYIEISDEGLELIEMISLDCTSKEGIWHSDEEIKIDKLGYVINKGKRQKILEWESTF